MNQAARRSLQDGGPLHHFKGVIAAMDVCLIYAPIVSWIADFLKRVPFLKQLPPPLIAWVLGFFAAWLRAKIGGSADTLVQLIQCALTTMAGAVATHEVITQPVLEPVAVAVGLKQPKLNTPK